MCDACGDPSHNPGTMMYKCPTCGNMSETEGECCGGPMQKVCDCGSGSFAKDCCQPE